MSDPDYLDDDPTTMLTQNLLTESEQKVVHFGGVSLMRHKRSLTSQLSRGEAVVITGGDDHLETSQVAEVELQDFAPILRGYEP